MLNTHRIVILTISLLTCISFLVMAWNGSYSASKDDSVGYVLTAERISNGSYFHHDDVYDIAYKELGDNISQSFLPSHHLGTAPGEIQSKYSLGLPMLLAAFKKIAGYKGYSVLSPFMNTIAVLGTGLLAYEIFRRGRYGLMIGALSALFLFVSPMFFIAGKIHPMTEGSVTAFLTFSTYFLLLAFRKDRLFFYVVAGLCFGYALSIRIPAILFILPIAFIWATYVSQSYPLCRISSYFKLVQKHYSRVLIYAISVLVGGVLVFVHNIKSTGNVANSTQLGHTRSFDATSLWSNNSKSVAGDIGGLERYGMTIDSNMILGIETFFLGLLVLLIVNRKIAVFGLLWILPTYFLYSSWLNPYPRYVTPCLPVIFMVSAFFVVQTLRYCFTKSTIVKTLCVVSFLVFILVTSSKLSFHIENIYRVSLNNNQSELPVPVFTSLDAKTLQSVKPKLQNAALIVYLGDRPEFRGVLETHLGVRTVVPFVYNTSDGSYLGKIDNKDMYTIISELQKIDRDIYVVEHSSTEQFVEFCEFCDQMPMYQFRVTFMDGLLNLYYVNKVNL